MFKHVLVALDRSTYSQNALPTAIEVAQKFGSDVFVLHVSVDDRTRAAAYSLETPAEATRLVAEAVKTVRDAGINAKGELKNVDAGHIAKAIVATAAANSIDLIVMGSRGLSDVQGLLLGSITHKVMHLANVPVLVDWGPARAKESSRATAVAEPAIAY